MRIIQSEIINMGYISTNHKQIQIYSLYCKLKNKDSDSIN